MIHVNNRLTASFLHILATSSPVLSLNRNLSIKINSNSHWDSENHSTCITRIYRYIYILLRARERRTTVETNGPTTDNKVGFLNLMGPWQNKCTLRPFLKCIIVYCYKQHLVKSDDKIIGQMIDQYVCSLPLSIPQDEISILESCSMLTCRWVTNKHQNIIC